MSGHRSTRRRWSQSTAATLAVALLAVVLASAPAAAQGSVNGRVAITERPGEATTDFNATVVYLVPADSGARPASPKPKGDKAGPAAIAMNGRAFVPHVRVIMPGMKVEFPNQDPFSHNIFSTATGAAFDLGLYGAGKSKDATFKRAGAFPIYCNIHPRMTAFVVVAPTPWYAQAGNDGRWTIEGVPAGQYTLHVWHERATEVKQPITVVATGLSDVSTTLDARGFKFSPHKNKFGKEYDKNSAVRY
jgi:plastocyanin